MTSRSGDLFLKNSTILLYISVSSLSSSVIIALIIAGDCLADVAVEDVDVLSIGMSACVLIGSGSLLSTNWLSRLPVAKCCGK